MKPTEGTQPGEIEITPDFMALNGRWINPEPGLPKDPTRMQLEAAGFVCRNISMGNGNGTQVDHIRFCAQSGMVRAFETRTRPDSVSIFTKPLDNSGVLNFKVPDSGTT